MIRDMGSVKVRRRTFRITAEQDVQIEEIARRVGLDKEQVVRLALSVGLPIVDGHLKNEVTEQIGAQLKKLSIDGVEDGKRR